MANTVPAAYDPPDPFAVSSGLALTSARVRPLIRAANYVRAHLGRRALISQAFPVAAGVYTWRDTKTLYGSGPSARWRIPQLPKCSTVQVYVSCHTSAARTTHEVKITSVYGGDTVVITPTATPTVYGPLDLDVDYSSGVEEIRAWSHGDGLTPVRVESIMVRAPVLASPLDTGILTDGFGAFDVDELQALEGLSADLAEQLRADLDALAGMKQIYLNWSALADTDEAANAVNSAMHAREHLVCGPVWDGTQAAGRELTIHARVTQPVDETRVSILGGPTPGSALAREIITIPGGLGGDGWHTGTIELQERGPDGRDLQVLPMGPGLRSTLLGVWPDATYRRAAIGPATLLHLLPDSMTTATVMSLAIWGR